MDLPRADILKRELSNMGAVYVVVVVLIAAALAFTLMPDREPALPGAIPADIIGSPSESE